MTNEWSLGEPHSRAALVSAVARRLPSVVSGFQLIAENWLAESSRIDLLGTADGDVVIACIADRGRELEGLGRALAHTQWVQPRLSDWLKLAPQLDFSPDSTVRSVLVCASMSPETRAAAEALPEGLATLYHARWLENASGADVLLDPITKGDIPASPAAVFSPPTVASVAERRKSGEGFRTGLTDADLDLTRSESAEFAAPPTGN